VSPRRALALLALVAHAACAGAVQPPGPEDDASPTHPADGAASADDAGAGGCGVVPSCRDEATTAGDPCTVYSGHCNDGTIRYAVCDHGTGLCTCTVLGRDPCQCRAVTGYTPFMCEHIRNCCWD
jgi:hypothetical protein